jgi:hypothetical protein
MPPAAKVESSHRRGTHLYTYQALEQFSRTGKRHPACQMDQMLRLASA